MTVTRAEEELRRVLPGAWDSIEGNYLFKLIHTIPRRIEAIIQLEGWYTKY